MNDLVIMKDKQAVTSSLQVAETFGKEHYHVLEAIEAKISSPENSGQYQKMFAEGTYKDKSGKSNKLYYMNRDGFSFIVMGFTGRKADTFKLQYIDAFNEMEQQVKSRTSALSPELQFMQGVVDKLAANERNQHRLENKIDGVSEIVATSTMDWRNETSHLISKIARQQGNTGESYKMTRNDIYDEVDRRGGVSLKTRLTNLRRRMAEEGTSKTQRKNTTKVDVIAHDKKLIEIYTAIVKEFAIRYQVWNEEY
ncbi:Rha family transcriptional regulator [Levilactobacillus tujiorum]|jgi:Rha family phage regulatory protein|uniref:Rha family transcriptional regulator n=1 Tax=Levilactobacillus tujiorum TaxID=2912243 RepID=A0ABX1L5C6_9LACO|nr:Rha family transcriptional regulator [Levilactobacillus tujiorum]NLR30256.1 Rha family transcriptional regulator [Levilactobacillus tujiorum]